MTQWGLDNLFNPGKRHMDDEKRRLQSTREEVGDASGGRRIDLEAGKVSITVRRPTDLAVDDQAADETALEPALEAEDLPALALANDEAEIAPELVDEPAASSAPPALDTTTVAAPAADTESVPAADQAAEVDDEVTDDLPIEAPEPAPVVAGPRRKARSAAAWSRRG